MQVLIIGGGMGGLCLAQGLKKAGISAKVFERQASATENLAGYGIHLDRNGIAALKACLPDALYARVEAAAGHAGTQLAFRTEQLGLLAVRDEAQVSGRPVSEVERRGIGRIELREILLDGLDDGPDPIMQWGKTFKRYERTADGKVRAYFEDGSEAVGDVLVGADASHSRVRQQYLPHIEREELGIYTIAGRYILDETRIKALPSPLTDGSLNNIVPAGPGWMFVSTWSSRPRDVDGRPAPAEHYVVWAYVGRAEVFPENVAELNGANLCDFVAGKVKGWSPHLRTIVAGADTATVALVPLRSMPVLEAWPASEVTVMGDAIHNMTPMAGVGANTALRDAAGLTKALTEVVAGHSELAPAIAGYEAAMRGYANFSVGMSRQNSERAANPAGFPRFMFRLILRLARRFPAVMRRTIGRPHPAT